jgi:hypothetical protein
MSQNINLPLGYLLACNAPLTGMFIWLKPTVDFDRSKDIHAWGILENFGTMSSVCKIW